MKKRTVTVPQQTLEIEEPNLFPPLEFTLDMPSGVFPWEAWTVAALEQLENLKALFPNKTPKSIGRSVKTILRIPAGYFKISKRLELPPNCSVVGNGDASVLEFRGGVGFVVTAEKSLTPVPGLRRVYSSGATFQDFTIYGPEGSTFIDVLGNHENLCFRNLKLKCFDGFYQKATGINFQSWNTDGEIYGCFFEALGTAVKGQPGQDPRIVGNKFQSCRVCIDAVNLHEGCMISGNDFLAHDEWCKSQNYPDMAGDTAVVVKGRSLVITGNRFKGYTTSMLVAGDGLVSSNFVEDGRALKCVLDTWESPGGLGNGGRTEGSKLGGNWQPAGPLVSSLNCVKGGEAHSVQTGFTLLTSELATYDKD